MSGHREHERYGQRLLLAALGQIGRPTVPASPVAVGYISTTRSEGAPSGGERYPPRRCPSCRSMPGTSPPDRGGYQALYMSVFGQNVLFSGIY